jgi:hypothetical protein
LPATEETLTIVPPTSRPHVRQHRLGQHERRPQVDRHHPIEVLDGQLGHRGGHVGPGRVHQHVDAPEGLHHPGHRPGQRLRVGQVGHHHQRPAPSPLDLGRSLLQVLAAAGQ